MNDVLTYNSLWQRKKSAHLKRLIFWIQLDFCSHLYEIQTLGCLCCQTSTRRNQASRKWHSVDEKQRWGLRYGSSAASFSRSGRQTFPSSSSMLYPNRVRARWLWMLKMEPFGQRRRRLLKGANTQTVPEYSRAGLGERTMSSLDSVKDEVKQVARFVTTLSCTIRGFQLLISCPSLTLTCGFYTDTLAFFNVTIWKTVNLKTYLCYILSTKWETCIHLFKQFHS